MQHLNTFRVRHLARPASRTPLALAALLTLAPALSQAVVYDWSSGNFTPGIELPGTIGAADTLNFLAGGSKTMMGGLLSNQGLVQQYDDLQLYGYAQIDNGARWLLQADASLSNAGYSNSFNNTGSFVKVGGSGASHIGSGIFFNNSGTLTAQTGRIVFSGGSANFNAGSVFDGAGIVEISSNAGFSGAFTSQNLLLSGGTLSGSAAQMNGLVRWTGGSLSGSWSLAAGQRLLVQGGAAQTVSGSFGNAGTITASDELLFYGYSQLSNSGRYELQGDVGLSNAGYSNLFENSGVFVKTAGSGSSYANNGIRFSNSGTVQALSGTIEFAGGAADFNDGSRFAGPGRVLVSNDASFAGTLHSENLQLGNGTLTGSGARITGQVLWTGGTLAGSWSVAGGHTLQLQAGGNKVLGGSLDNQGLIAAQDTLLLYGYNTLTNQGVYALQGDVGLGNAGYSNTFVNEAVLRKSDGSGSSVISGIAFVNNGQIDVQTGTLEFASGNARFNDGTLFSGAGLSRIDSDARFVGGFATTGRLQLAAGTFTGGDGSDGSRAVANGPLAWTGGMLAGRWEIAAGTTVDVQAGALKLMGAQLDNLGRLRASDDLHLYGYMTLGNAGTYEMSGDVGLLNGGYNNTFVNTGRLLKSGGTGSSLVSGIGFLNQGTVEVQTGTVHFTGGADFRDGSRFEGAGTVRVSGSNSFSGAQHSQNLHIAGGRQDGNGAVVMGTLRWTGGTLAGTWEVAAGQTLLLEAGETKYMGASMGNHGRVTARDDLYLYDYKTFTNAGVYELAGDVGLLNGGYSNQFVNAGVLHKSAGSGMSRISGIGFSNTAEGRIVIDSGTLSIDQALANAGVLDFGIAGLDRFGTLAINGALTMDGTVAAHFLDGYRPVVGDSFKLISFASASSAFGNDNWTFDGVTFTPLYQAGDFSLLVSAVAAVPESPSLALMLAGLGVLATLARRRRPR